MSEQTTRMSATEDSLRSIVQHVAGSRLQAADRLLAGKPEAKSLCVIIEYVPRRRDNAAKRLLALDEKCVAVDDYDKIFDFVSRDDQRLKAGQKILAMPPEEGRFRYARVGTEIESLRQSALEKLLAIGPDDVEDLNFIWQHANPEVRDDQWRRFTERARLSYRYVQIVLEGMDDLPERAWQNLAGSDDVDSYQWFSMFLLSEFRERVWQKITATQNNKWTLGHYFYELYDRFSEWQERIWTELIRRYTKGDGWKTTLAYASIATNKDACPGVRERARNALVGPSTDEFGLRQALYIPTHRDQAAKRLLEGTFLPEEK